VVAPDHRRISAWRIVPHPDEFLGAARFGRQVEQIYGARRFIVIYFASTVLGFLASTFWSENLSIGASAGIFGLIGAMIALGVRHRSPLGDAIRGHYLRWAIYGFAIGLIPVFAWITPRTSADLPRASPHLI
jgi:membrane associated rhomboid family serine protease